MNDTTTNAQSPRGARRRFLELIATILVAIPILGPLFLAVRTVVMPGKKRERKLVPALPLAQIPENAVKRFRLQYARQHGAFVEQVSRLVFLRRKGDEVVALSAECTHLGCNVHFDAEARSFACPCHKGVFDLDGKVVSGPPPEPLHRYEVELPEGDGPVVLKV